jgi:cell division FtsZ-interacting protein ZapD
LAKEKNYKEIIQKMEQVLQYSSVVTKNIFEKSIFKILTFLKEDEVSFSILKEIYERILTKVQSVNKV